MALAHLTVKSIAAYLKGTRASQSKILRDHKYPKQEPQVHQPPFYQIAIGGLRQYYRSNNSLGVLAAALNRAQSIGQKIKREHNVRVLETFRDSPLAQRRFEVQRLQPFSAVLERVNVRLSADMQAKENGTFRIVYFHCRREPIDEATAILMADVAHWVMLKNRIQLRPSQVEIFDLSNGESHRVRSWRESAIAELASQAPTISARWNET